MDKLILLKEYLLSSKLNETGFTLIAAAGFEKRGIASLELIKNLKIQITDSIILKYEDEELNRPYSEKISSIARSISRNYYETNIGNELEEKLLNILKQEKNKVLVDITCMSRFYIFYILDTLYINDIEYHIIYTEAEEYFPTKKF